MRTEPRPNKALNIADITNPANTEGALIAAMFAAQGYIVVAPNYAGYDISTLGYHPFLNAVQQSGEMMDILAAARTALPNTMTSATSDNGKLFITGYSEGGHVAMATLRAMQAAGEKVTAAAPMSGPYALEAFGDVIFFGGVDLGSTVFSPLLANSYQHAYGNIDSTADPIFSPTYAGAETLLPSDTPIDDDFPGGSAAGDGAVRQHDAGGSIPGCSAVAIDRAARGTPDPCATTQRADSYCSNWASATLTSSRITIRVSYALDAATNPDGAVPTPTPGVPLRRRSSRHSGLATGLLGE